MVLGGFASRRTHFEVAPVFLAVGGRLLSITSCIQQRAVALNNRSKWRVSSTVRPKSNEAIRPLHKITLDKADIHGLHSLFLGSAMLDC